MIRIPPALLLASLLALPAQAETLLPPLDESPLARGVPTHRVPGRALVRLHGFDEDALRALVKQPGERARLQARLFELEDEAEVRLRLVRTLSFGWALYDVSPRGSDVRVDEESTRQLVRALAADKRVAGASADRWVRTLARPNDPGMAYTWHYDSLGAEGAWDVVTGSSTQRVGVVDTGTLRNHEDLSAKDAAGYDFISEVEISNDGDGRDADYTDSGDGGDCGDGFQPNSWHGSHVAGTILASTDNGRGIAGMSWAARLVTGRAIGVCGGTTSDIMEALAWMSGYIIDGVPNVGANAVDVVNMSLGTDNACSQYEDEYISTILSQTDVVIVAAAGNSGNNEPVGAPANCDGVISVGAHGPGASRPLVPYSNYSSDLDIIGPGGDHTAGVVEDGVLSLCGPGNDCYTYHQGTSMASPHVAGAVSLLRAANPTLSAAEIRNLLRSEGESCAGCGSTPAVRADLAVIEAASRPGGVGVPPPTTDPDDDTDDDTGGDTGGSTGGDTGGTPTAPTTDPTGECDTRRGNWDCANGQGCVDDDGDGYGECVFGAEGDRGSGGLCNDPTDCASGLCDRGVCTVPCDKDCRDGYTCQWDAIPGGICRADSCQSSEGGICGDGWHCTYSSASRYVCAADGEDIFARGCRSLKATRSEAPFAALALAGLALLVGRRRRRR